MLKFVKFILILFTLVLLFSSTWAQNSMIEISNAIYTKQLRIRPKERELKSSFHDIRIRQELSSRIELHDTLFLLEAFDITDGSYFGRIWNDNTSTNYTYFNGSFEFTEQSVFFVFTCGFIEEWNIKAIRNKEKVDSTMTNPLTIYGSFIVIENDKVKAKCVKFKEFHNFEK